MSSLCSCCGVPRSLCAHNTSLGATCRIFEELQATCNVNQSFFNDWITGHLNLQIEHHLFPTMPRHNYWKVAPLVKSMCAKHGIDYQSKPLFTGFKDILRSLKDYGEVWFKAYQE